MPPSLPTGGAVTALHDTLLDAPGWPAREPAARDAGLWHWVQTNHRFNCLLWAEEDLARRTTVVDAEIAANKRAIDATTRRATTPPSGSTRCCWSRSALSTLYRRAPTRRCRRVPAGARLNSETAGSMIDRLSIMALKVHAMRLQTERRDVDEAHRAASRAKLGGLQQQRADLAGLPRRAARRRRAGRAYFKVYRQFKMYNDPRFNPALVAERRRSHLRSEPRGSRRVAAGRGDAARPGSADT